MNINNVIQWMLSVCFNVLCIYNLRQNIGRKSVVLFFLSIKFILSLEDIVPNKHIFNK